VALAQKLTPTRSAQLGHLEPPSAWRPSAGDLTPAQAASAASGDAPSDQHELGRLVMRVDGGSLGELEVTLDRRDGALRVVIGMENQDLVGAVLPDTAALRAALEKAGVSVQSLNVVPASQVGTVLAQRRPNPSGSESATESAAEQENEPEPKKPNKRLTLIG
jgi:flagellar hook-length control protein FliK